MKIPFTLSPDEEFDFAERHAFWDSAETRQWFQERGYTLYKRYIEVLLDMPVHPCTEPSLPFEEFRESDYPFAYHDIGNIKSPVDVVPLRAFDNDSGKVVFAQNSQMQHCAIKVVKDDTSEYRILRFLSQMSHDVLRENCILPVLEILPAPGFWFVVMPRWGSEIYHPYLKNMREVLHLIESMLKALRFLHQHNIAHRDIKFPNMLVNHFSDDMSMTVNLVRGELRSEGRLLYAMFDFSSAIMLPPTAKKEDFRLPYYESWAGSYSFPCDTDQGEFDYNPFVFDVGVLGVELTPFFQHFGLTIPMLAPLFDRMLTHDLKNRFTADEALEFFQNEYSELTEQQLNKLTYPKPPCDQDEGFDCWDSISPHLAEKWTRHRTPPLPLSHEILRWLRKKRPMQHVLPWTRWFFFNLVTFPRRVFKLLQEITKLGLALDTRSTKES